MKKTREWAWKAALAAYLDKADKPTGTILVLLTFYPPGAYHYDKDNLQASCKGYLDGLAQAWGVNDNQFDPRVQIAEPVRGGKIVVTLP